MTTANLTKVIVPCRLSYAHLWEPDSINGSEPKYSVSCIIDKNDKETIAKIKKAIEVAAGIYLALVKDRLYLSVHDLRCLFTVGIQEHSVLVRLVFRSVDVTVSERGIFRLLRKGIHYILRLQQQRQQGHCCRTWKCTEVKGRRASRFQSQSEG